MRLAYGKLDEPVQDAAFDAAVELQRALSKFGPMASPHEGWAVIREELDELWEHVRANTGRSDAARVEAIQVAAMALRYAHDLCPDGGTRITDPVSSREATRE